MSFPPGHSLHSLCTSALMKLRASSSFPFCLIFPPLNLPASSASPVLPPDLAEISLCHVAQLLQTLTMCPGQSLAIPGPPWLGLRASAPSLSASQPSLLLFPLPEVSVHLFSASCDRSCSKRFLSCRLSNYFPWPSVVWIKRTEETIT